MTTTEYKHVFGPVPSRRLGRSLGVDLVPFKTCTYDCIYCQLGRTTNKTVTRKEYVPLKNVLNEVGRRIMEGAAPDYITLSGSGEPTLYSELRALIHGIRSITYAPLVVLTNGSLLWDKDVQDALLEANLVIPSLDAGDAKIFEFVNRPHPDISFEKMVGGLAEFREKFSGRMWIEIFLVGGISAIPAEVEKIAAHVERIRPDRVQLNTVVRPPAEEFAFQVPMDQMQRFAEMFGRNAEVIADIEHVHQERTFSATREDVLSLLKRRPCSLGDICDGLGIHRNEAVKHLGHLLEESLVTQERSGGETFYVAKLAPSSA